MQQINKRLRKELRDLQEDQQSVCSIETDDDDLSHWKAAFLGPAECPYAQRRFELDIRFPEKYPFAPPKLIFLTKIWHPNISWKTGNICMDVLANMWSPALTIKSLVVSLQSLLACPEPHDPIEPAAANMFLTDQQQFLRAAQYFDDVFSSKSILHRKMQIQKLLHAGFSTDQANLFFEAQEGHIESRSGPLTEYFLAKARGGKSELPDGYVPEVIKGVPVLRHKGSDVILKAQPLRPTSASNDLAVVYHYAPPGAFFPICLSGEVWATLLRTAKNDKDTCHGDGVYTTGKSPCEFGSKEAILINNFSNKTDYIEQISNIQKHLDCADFCIPLLVPATAVYDVMKVSTPEQCYTPGYNRHGKRLRADCDVRVVVLQDLSGKVQNAKETAKILLHLVDHLNKDVRRHALVAIGKMPESCSPAVVEAIARRLRTERMPEVWNTGLKFLFFRTLVIPNIKIVAAEVLALRRADPDPEIRSLVSKWTLERNHDFMAVAMKEDYKALEYAPKELRGSHDFMALAVKEDSRALEYATEELRGNHSFMAP